MGIHGFPRFLGKSGVYLIQPPSCVQAYLAPPGEALSSLEKHRLGAILTRHGPELADRGVTLEQHLGRPHRAVVDPHVFRLNRH